MKAILRIFKYARKRIIALSLENKMLKVQIEYYRAIVESDIQTFIDNYDTRPVDLNTKNYERNIVLS